jgi:hypothetical protein
MAAREALDKLGKVNEPVKEPTTSTFTRPKARKNHAGHPPGRRVLLAGGARWRCLLSGQPAGASDLAQKLGTKLPLVSTSRSGSAARTYT